MNDDLKVVKKKNFSQIMAEFFFVIYLISVYFFNSNAEYVAIARIIFLPFAGFTMLYLLQRKRFYIGKNVMLVYLSCTWILASFFWAHNQYLAWINVKTMWQIFLLFFLVYNLFCEREDPHEFLLRSLYWAGLALIGYTLYTYGFAEIINMMSKSSNVRLGDEISQANVFGMQHATTTLVAFYYFLYKKKYKPFHIIILAMSFLMAMSSGSRKAVLIIGIGVLYLIYKKYGIRQIYKLITVGIVMVFLFIAVIRMPIFETVRTRMEGAVNVLKGGVGESSAEIRMNMIKDGWTLFKERILTGYGARNYAVVSRYRTYAHNNFIEILVDFGLIGFTLYYLIYWNALKNLWKAQNDSRKALFCIFLVRFMMEIAAVTYYDKVHWIMFAFFLMKPIEGENNIEGEIEDEIIP